MSCTNNQFKVEYAYESASYVSTILGPINRYELKKALCLELKIPVSQVRIFETGPGAHFRVWSDDESVLSEFPVTHVDKLLLYSNTNVDAIPYLASQPPPLSRCPRQHCDLVIAIALIMILLWLGALSVL